MEHLTIKPDHVHNRANRKTTPGKIAGVVASLLFLASCANNEAGAEKTPTPNEQTTHVTVERPTPTIQEAEALLNDFNPVVSPTLREFETDTNHERAKRDAEAYLALKNSKLVIVNFTDLSADQVKEFGSTVEERIESVTRGTFHVQVDTLEANDVAKKLYHQHISQPAFNQENARDYAAVIADVAIPAVDDSYASVIALTDTGFHGRSFTLSSGKYADIANVDSEYAAILSNGGNSESDSGLLRDPRNSTVHEWLHAVANLEHSKSAMNNLGDLSGNLIPGEGSVQRVDLGDFLASAQIDEYGGGGIMGATQELGDNLPTLTPAELFETEAAERLLQEPHLIGTASLANTEVTYQPQDHDDLAVYHLDTTGPDNGSGLHGIDRLTFSPIFQDGITSGDSGYWSVQVVGLTPENASIKLGYLDMNGGGTITKVLELPDDKIITITKHTDNTLGIR